MPNDENYIITKWWLFQHQKIFLKKNTCESQKWIHLPQTNPCDMFFSKKTRSKKTHLTKNMEDFTVFPPTCDFHRFFNKMERDSTWNPSLWRIAKGFPIVNSSPNPGWLPQHFGGLTGGRVVMHHGNPWKLTAGRTSPHVIWTFWFSQKNSNGWNPKKFTSRTRIIYVNMEPEKFGFRWFSRISSVFLWFFARKNFREVHSGEPFVT